MVRNIKRKGCTSNLGSAYGLASPVPARPNASLSFCQCLACDFTNHHVHSLYVGVGGICGLVDLFTVELVEIDLVVVFSYLVLHSDRNTYIQAYVL